MTKDWEPYQEEIRKLYQVEAKPLAEVMRLVEGKHGERSYRSQLRKWGYMKHSTQDFPKPVRKARSRRRGIHAPARSSDSVTVSVIQNEPGSSDSFGNPIHASEHASYRIGQNEQDYEGKTQLHQATLGQDTEQVRMLLYAGAAVDIQDHAGNMPLHYAITKNDAGIAQLLLRFGTEVNAKGQLGRSPLHLAVPDLDLISLLLKHGADPSQQDDRGDTPLHLALSFAFLEPRNFRKLVDPFLSSGSDLNRANKDGVTPFLRFLDQLHLASDQIGYTSSFLERGASILKALPDGRTPLQLFLYSSGTDVLYRERNYLSQEKNDILKSFLDKGASIMTPIRSGQPLVLEYFRKHRHRWNEDPELGGKFCKLVPPGEASEISSLILLEIGARPGLDAPPTAGDLIKILIQKGADPNYQNQQKETPLILLFTDMYRISVVTKAAIPLLAHGGDPWQMDSSGKCAIFEAEKRFPDNGHELLRAMLGADLQHQKPSSTRDDMSGATRRECWEGWEQAARAVDWSEVKRHILHQPINPSQKIGSVLRDSALAALAEKHVHLARDKFQEVELRRRYVAGILRDCKEREISLHVSCTDYLIELCL
ncbi:hypothetical protein ACJZ2D_012858 [Fusarium nematophilum]